MMESRQTRLDDVTLVSRSARIPSLSSSVRDIFDIATSPRVVWSAPDETTVLGSGAAATIVATGSDRFESVRDAAESLFSTGDVHAGSEVARPRLFGGFAFHAERADSKPWKQFPNAQFIFPRVQITWSTDTHTETDTADNDSHAWITVNAVDPGATPDAVEYRLSQEIERVKTLESTNNSRSPPGVTCRHRRTSRDAWNRGVTAAINRISADNLQKVVLAQALEVELEETPVLGDIITRLGEHYPSCYRFIIEPVPDTPVDQRIHTDVNEMTTVGSEDIHNTSQSPAFFGATPERLVSVRGRTVETGALAGTTGRGETTAEDEWLAAELARDEKNVHEHELVAETIREQLSPYATAITSDSRRVRKLATVQHLWTPITATLEEDKHALSLVEALHPTPAVGGLPPTTAAETIRETEPFDRGWYAAPVGWIDAAGYGTFVVALRSAVAHDDAATLFAGVGIVADSNPDSEWDEVQLKYRPILDELESNDAYDDTINQAQSEISTHTQGTVDDTMNESASTSISTPDTTVPSESNSQSNTTMEPTSDADADADVDADADTNTNIDDTE